LERYFIGFPIILCVIAILGIYFLIKYETPKFLISKGKENEALESIKMSYHKNEIHDDILEYLKKNSSK
jgi:hypothetical protein